MRNALLPTLDAFVYYGGSGVGGNVNPALLPPACDPTLQNCFNAANAPPPFVNGGPVSYGSTLNQLVNSTAPDKGVGLSLTIPLRNRLAQSNQVRGELEYRQAQVREHQLENQVRIEVRNAQFDVKQNRVAVQAAQSAVDLARQTLDADQQKLKVGLTTQTAILQDAATLTTGESNLVSAKAAYEKSRIELDRATGLLLDHAGINVADATRGQVTHLPTYRSSPRGRTRLLTEYRHLRLRKPFNLRHREGRCSDDRLIHYAPMRLSVVIITFNEEANLGRTLASVQPLVADGKGEIIVVDSGSTDRTVEIAKSFGAKVFIEEWKGFSAQKNSAIDKATGDWILSLDADEELDSPLQKALQELLESLARLSPLASKLGVIVFRSCKARRDAIPHADFAGIWIPRKNEFLGRWIRHGGFWPDPKLRLFRRGKGKFENRAVHEDVRVDGITRQIQSGALLHHSYPTLSDYIEHMNRYSSLGAEMVVAREGKVRFS